MSVHRETLKKTILFIMQDFSPQRRKRETLFYYVVYEDRNHPNAPEFLFQTLDRLLALVFFSLSVKPILRGDVTSSL